jgi:hypothetical protein
MNTAKHYCPYCGEAMKTQLEGTVLWCHCPNEKCPVHNLGKEREGNMRNVRNDG